MGVEVHYLFSLSFRMSSHIWWCDITGLINMVNAQYSLFCSSVNGYYDYYLCNKENRTHFNVNCIFVLTY